MPRATPALTLAALLAVPVAPPIALAQPETSPSQATAGEAEARAALQRAAEKYRSLKSYSDTLRVKYDFRSEDGENLPTPEMSATFHFASPRSFRITSEQGAIICDGVHLWMHSVNTGEYTEQPAPESPAWDDFSVSAMMLMLPKHPLTDVLLGPSTPPLLLEHLHSVESVLPESRAGEPGLRISGRGTAPDLSPDDETTFPMTVWISDRTGLIGEMTVDVTDQMKKMYAEMEDFYADIAGDDEAAAEAGIPKLQRAVIVTTLEGVRADSDLPADTFTFRPGPEDKKVDELSSPWEMNTIDQNLLVGHPAPEFQGTLLDGKPFTLSDLRGKVVLLDFWATWCGPCVQALPHIQKIADRFADRPVVVLGMNRDQFGSEERIRKFLERKKITFPQFLDFDGEAADKYGVTGIPCTFLIDAKGILQYVSVGFTPGHDEVLAEHIEALLAGRDLFDPAAVSATPPTFPSQDSTGEASNSATSAEDVNPESLVASSPLSGLQHVNAYQMRRFDVDGDGRDEWIAPDMNAGLAVISPDGGSATRIRLRGGKHNESIHYFQPVRFRDETYWLVSRASWSAAGQKSNVTLHRPAPDASALWTFRPQTPDSSNIQVAAADLTGDGVPEIVLGISTFKMKRTAENEYMHDQPSASLAILDWEGNLLAQRRVGNHIQLLIVGEPGSPGEPAQILVGTDQRVRRFTFDPSRISAQPIAEDR